jgi:hypothetical protein
MHVYVPLKQEQISVPELQALKAPELNPPPAPPAFEVHTSPFMGVPLHGLSPGIPPPPPLAEGAPPAPGAPLLLSEPAAPGLVEPALPGLVEPALPGLVEPALPGLVEPALPGLLEPALALPLPAAPPLSPELPPQAVTAASPNKTIPNR